MEAQWWWWFYQLLVKRITAHCEVVGPGLTSHFLKRFQQLKQSEDDWALCAVHTIATIAAQSLDPVRHICLYMSCQCYQPIFVILCKYKGIQGNVHFLRQGNRTAQRAYCGQTADWWDKRIRGAARDEDSMNYLLWTLYIVQLLMTKEADGKEIW